MATSIRQARWPKFLLTFAGVATSPGLIAAPRAPIDFLRNVVPRHSAQQFIKRVARFTCRSNNSDLFYLKRNVNILRRMISTVAHDQYHLKSHRSFRRSQATFYPVASGGMMRSVGVGRSINSSDKTHRITKKPRPHQAMLL